MVVKNAPPFGGALGLRLEEEEYGNLHRFPFDIFALSRGEGPFAQQFCQKESRLNVHFVNGSSKGLKIGAICAGK